MKLLLGVFAVVMMAGYAFYCWKILKARPQSFEQMLMSGVAEWMTARGPASRTSLWMLYVVSALLVITYFVMVFTVFDNPALQYITAALVGVELYHLITTFRHFRRFFAGQSGIMRLLNWKLERLCALLYFAHALLVLISLFFIS